MAEGEAPLDLAADEIHVWRGELDQPEATVERLARALSPDEQERARRFVLERVRTRYVVGMDATIQGIIRRVPDRMRDRLVAMQLKLPTKPS